MATEQEFRELRRQVAELTNLVDLLQDCCRCVGEPFYRRVNTQLLHLDEFGNWVLPEGFQQVSDLFPEGCLTGKDTSKGIVFYQDAIAFCQYVSPEDINDPNSGWQLYDWIRKP